MISIDPMGLKKDRASITNYTDGGKCSNCGGCCSNYIPISSKDIKSIKAYIKKHKIVERRVLLPIRNSSIDLTCPFRDEDNKVCTIYEVRPEICRTFKCDKSMDYIEKVKNNLHQKYDVIDMRKEFFGGKRK